MDSLSRDLGTKSSKGVIMNNRPEKLAGYKPRVSIYPKTHASGKVDYYVSYYLPGVKRKVARPLYCKKS